MSASGAAGIQARTNEVSWCRTLGRLCSACYFIDGHAVNQILVEDRAFAKLKTANLVGGAHVIPWFYGIHQSRLHEHECL